MAKSVTPVSFKRSDAWKVRSAAEVALPKYQYSMSSSPESYPRARKHDLHFVHLHTSVIFT